MTPIENLRAVCVEYPRDSVQRAVERSFTIIGGELREQQELAALVTAWLTAPDAAEDPPPLAPRVG
jgi:hypothetical protein